MKSFHTLEVFDQEIITSTFISHHHTQWRCKFNSDPMNVHAKKGVDVDEYVATVLYTQGRSPGKFRILRRKLTVKGGADDITYWWAEHVGADNGAFRTPIEQITGFELALKAAQEAHIETIRAAAKAKVTADKAANVSKAKAASVAEEREDAMEDAFEKERARVLAEEEAATYAKKIAKSHTVAEEIRGRSRSPSPARPAPPPEPRRKDAW